MVEPIPLFKTPTEKKRFQDYLDRANDPLHTSDIGFLYNVLCQCFLPYRDPGVSHWEHKNGKYSIVLSAGAIHDPHNPEKLIEQGLPYGPKPRLFLCYISSMAVKRQSPVVPIPPSMSAMLKELGLNRTGGQRGAIQSFKNQIMRLAACHFTIAGPGPKGSRRYTKAPPIKSFDIWLNGKESVWPTEIILTDDFFRALKDHAVPYDIRALRSIQNNARAIDIFLWWTQRLSQLRRPLLMKWVSLFELFGGNMDAGSYRSFKQTFRKDAMAARMAYPEARMEETPEGFRFHPSAPAIPKLFISNKR